jgi:hypothetical protein
VRCSIAPLLLALLAVPSSLSAQTVLRDGRWFSGGIVERRGTHVVVSSPAGRLTFPEWMIDRRGSAPRLAEIRGARDRTIARRRREKPLEQKAEQAVRKKLRPLESEVRKLRGERNVARLRALARRLESGAETARTEFERRETGALARDAWRGVADLLPKETRAERIERAEALLAAHRAGCDGGTGQAPFIRSLLKDDFESDPWTWGPLVELVEESEAFDRIEIRWRGRWLWSATDVDWVSDRRSVPTKFRIVTSSGRAEVRPQLPTSPNGTQSVWKADVRAQQTGGMIMTNIGAATVYDYDARWRRLFWCPVEGRFGTESVPAKLGRVRLEVWSRLGVLRSRERTAVQSFRSALRSYRIDVDLLARKGVDLTQRLATNSGRDSLKRTNQRLRDAKRKLDESLAIRAEMQPWFDRLRVLDERLAQASRGESVEIPTIPPK